LGSATVPVALVGVPPARFFSATFFADPLYLNFWEVAFFVASVIFEI
jgi:hypothetical protein